MTNPTTCAHGAEQEHIAELEAAWQPIETAPKDGNSILVGSPPDEDTDWPGIVDKCYWDGDHNGGAWVLDGEGSAYSRAPCIYTVWMPLPKPPTITGGA